MNTRIILLILFCIGAWRASALDLFLSKLALPGGYPASQQTPILIAHSIKTVDGPASTTTPAPPAPPPVATSLFKDGVTTHAGQEWLFKLDGQAVRFTAKVGVTDTTQVEVPVDFFVEGDGRILWQSGPMKKGQPAQTCTVALRGIRHFVLRVERLAAPQATETQLIPAWADARIEYSKEPPQLKPLEVAEPYVLTPPPPAPPRIRNPRIIGVRPNHPVLFTIPVTGDRPMSFAAVNIPPGLTLHGHHGILSGTITAKGEYKFLVEARNHRGFDRQEFTLVVGSRIALTPPMGWNSWNIYADRVSSDDIRSMAQAMIRKGLAQHGWAFVNIDDGWQRNPASTNVNTGRPLRNPDGTIRPNERFPAMGALVEYIHSLGLKFGVYSSPGQMTCAGYAGSLGHEVIDAQTYAKWGVDFLKYDWCSYEAKAADHSLVELMKPYLTMYNALRKQGRDIVFSICQYGMGNVSAWGEAVGGNCWRTTTDITDTWESVSSIGFGQAGWESFAAPGRWNDPDMLVIGWLGWGDDPRPSRLTPDEQYAHMSLWCLLSAPLLLGCDLNRLDEFTLNLITNDEVLEINQDALGRQAERMTVHGRSEIWAKPMADGSLAVGLFNRNPYAHEIQALWSDLRLQGIHRVRDLWRQQDLGHFSDSFSRKVPAHGVALLRLWPTAEDVSAKKP